MCGGHAQLSGPYSLCVVSISGIPDLLLRQPLWDLNSLWAGFRLLRTPKLCHMVGSETCQIHGGLFSRLDCDANYPCRLFWCEVLNLDAWTEEISILFLIFLSNSKAAQSSQTTTSFNNPTATQNKCQLVPYILERTDISLADTSITINSYQIDLGWCIDLQHNGKICSVPLIPCLFGYSMTLQWLGTEVTLRTCTDCSTLDTGSFRTTIPNPSSYSYFLRFPIAEVFNYESFFLPQGQCSYALLWPQRICWLYTVFTMHCTSMAWDDGMHGTEHSTDTRKGFSSNNRFCLAAVSGDITCFFF